MKALKRVRNGGLAINSLKFFFRMSLLSLLFVFLFVLPFSLYSKPADFFLNSAYGDRRAQQANGVSLPPPELVGVDLKTGVRAKVYTGVYKCPVQLLPPPRGARVRLWQNWEVQGNECLAAFDAVEASFLMPEHSHGSQSLPAVQFNPKMHSIQVNKVRLQMPGWWQLKVLFFKSGKAVDGVVVDVLVLP